jgi:hypothetical protein
MIEIDVCSIEVYFRESGTCVMMVLPGEIIDRNRSLGHSVEQARMMTKSVMTVSDVCMPGCDICSVESGRTGRGWTGYPGIRSQQVTRRAEGPCSVITYTLITGKCIAGTVLTGTIIADRFISRLLNGDH